VSSKAFDLEDYDSWPSGPLADVQIAWLAENRKMIDPFVDHAVRVNEKGDRVLSYGLGSMGYDFRVRPKWKVFTPTGRNVIVDPKNMQDAAFVNVDNDSVDIPPNGFVLAASIERFEIPPDVICSVYTKSSYARCGISMQMTPLEPGWTGYVTVEIGNTTPHAARVYANEGIGQVLFFKGSVPCLHTYANKNEAGAAGKYQDQAAEITLPRL
jgi:dCTP deaminase